MTTEADREPLPTMPLSVGRIVAILVVGLLSLAILLGLGVWQMERRAWKEALLATIDQRIHDEPRSADAILAEQAAGEAIDYKPVLLRGTFEHSGERYFLATRQGEAGWHVYTPLRLEGSSRWLFVNRGFVPYAMKDLALRASGNPEGPVSIAGLVRTAPSEKPGSFLPDNDPRQNVFFWRNIADMAQGLALSRSEVLPFFVDAGPSADVRGGPIGGTTVIDLPNDHLQYAITWFSLAAALFVMLALFVRHLLRTRTAGATG